MEQLFNDLAATRWGGAQLRIMLVLLPRFVEATVIIVNQSELAEEINSDAPTTCRSLASLREEGALTVLQGKQTSPREYRLSDEWRKKLDDAVRTHKKRAAS